MLHIFIGLPLLLLVNQLDKGNFQRRCNKMMLRFQYFTYAIARNIGDWTLTIILLPTTMLRLTYLRPLSSLQRDFCYWWCLIPGNL